MVKKKDIFRILDANLNRCKEGLRVSEEVVRFALNDKKLTIYLRQLRHQVAEAINKLPLSYSQLLSARQAKNDVGKKNYSERQSQSLDYKKIILINLQRVKEALRVLEEFSSFLDTNSARQFQNLRFKIYNLEKIIFERF